MVAIARPQGLNGLEVPGYVSGCNLGYPPTWGINDMTSLLTTTSTRLYYVPYWFTEIRSFTGLRTFNGGAGDNGEVYRVGVYKATLTSGGLRGGPSTLLVDCGEITLTAAAAVRNAATTVTPDYVGLHWLAVHHNSAASMVPIVATHSGTTEVGLIQSSPSTFIFGSTAFNATINNQRFGALYVDTAYAALASTAVAPTSMGVAAPIIGPYIT